MPHAHVADAWQVRKLVREGFNVIVQPSKMRIFTDDQYAKAGALLKARARMEHSVDVLSHCRMISALHR